MDITSKLENILGSLAPIVPELWLVAVFFLLIILDLWNSPRITRSLPYVLMAALVLQFFLVGTAKDGVFFLGMLHIDGTARFFKYLFMLSGIFTVLVSLQSNFIFDHHATEQKQGKGEYYSLITAMLLGAHLLSMASNLVTIYLSLEMLSMGGYILALFRFTRKSTEAGMKYILFGAFSSAVMLYGMSLLYGFTGSLSLEGIARAASALPVLPMTVALALTSVGFLFKISAVPFHIWTPDIYEGAPAPAVAFFSVVPKAAGIAILFRIAVTLGAIPAYNETLTNLLAAVALASVIIGNLSALWQIDAKRMLAYSSIAHAGFMLTGMVALSQTGLQSLLFYMATYLFINFGAFLLLIIGENYLHTDRISGFKGLGTVSPFFGVMMLLVMIALVGLPPTVGFTAKLLVFSALWEKWQLTASPLLMALLVAGLFSTAASLYFYLKLPFFMFFRAPDEHEAPFVLTWGQKVLILVLVLPILGMFFWAGRIVEWMEKIITN